MELLFLLAAAGLALGLGGLSSSSGDSGGSGDDAADAPPPTLEGNSEANLLEGSPLIDDVILGRAGADTITGDVGNDFLDGGLGNDEIDGGFGDDTISGARGDDTIDGGPGNDSILGFGGADFIDGGEDNDSIRGGDGPDTIIGNLGEDSLEGGLGGDTISGILADPETFPTDDADEADTLEGWGGSDTIVLGSGDTAFGEFATTPADNLGDTFVVGTWINGDPATISDFNPAVDTIEYYRAGGEVLDLTAVDLAGDVTYQLTADGDVVVQIPVGMSGTIVNLSNVTVIDPV